MKPIEHDTAIDWLKQTCAVIREMDAENRKLKSHLESLVVLLCRGNDIDAINYIHENRDSLKNISHKIKKSIEGNQ